MRYTRENIDEIKLSVDLLPLAEACTDLQRKASTKGGEYKGPCPFCGGKDRFCVQPNHHKGGKWMCRYCTDGRFTDVIEFVERRDKVSFLEACDYLSGKIKLSGGRKNPPKQSKSDHIKGPPAIEWQKEGIKFIQYSEQVLWSNEGRSALQYLQNRGLNDKMIKDSQLGFNPINRSEKIEKWGLQATPQSRGIILSKGIIIPCYINNRLWNIKIRRLCDSPKYIFIKGSKPALFGADQLLCQDNGFLTEGEFDALLARQHIGDIFGVVSFGSATQSINLQLWGKYILPLHNIFIAYDNDDAGRAGALKLSKKLSKSHVLNIPSINPADKDLTDFHLSGGDLRQWLIDQCREKNIDLGRSEIASPNFVPDEKSYGRTIPPIPRAGQTCVTFITDNVLYVKTVPTVPTVIFFPQQPVTQSILCESSRQINKK